MEDKNECRWLKPRYNPSSPLGACQGEIFQKTRGNKSFRQSLEDDTYNHHKSYRVHGQNGRFRIQHISRSHAQSGQRHDKHSDGHRSKGCPVTHQLGDQVDTQHYDRKG